MLLIDGKVVAETSDAIVDVLPVVEQLDNANAHFGKPVFIEPGADAPAYRRHKSAEAFKGLEIHVGDVVVDQRLTKHLALQFYRVDVAFDPTVVFAAGDHRLRRRAQHVARQIEHGSLELMGLQCGRRRHRHQADFRSRALVRTAIAAAWPWAIESSMVSGPVAAPATYTPGRDVAAIAP